MARRKSESSNEKPFVLRSSTQFIETDPPTTQYLQNTKTGE